MVLLSGIWLLLRFKNGERPHLTRDSMDYTREVVVLDLSVLHPRREVSHLSVISVVREPHFRAYVEDLSAVNDDTTIVDDVLVDHWPIYQVQWFDDCAGKETLTCQYRTGCP